MEDILKTCLHQKHLDLGAKMMPFGGFDMPIEYTTIIEEHNAVRHAAGIFDVSHMGEILITGPDSERYSNHILTNDIRNAEIGKIFYGMMLYPEGGTVDDLLVYKMGEERFFLVVNASNIAKDFQWIVEHSTGYDLKIENLSDYYGEVAVQGHRKTSEPRCERPAFLYLQRNEIRERNDNRIAHRIYGRRRLRTIR